MHPDDELTRHFRLIAPQTSALRRLSIRTVRDLLYHFPSRFEHAGADGTTRTLVPGTKVTLVGTLSKLEAKKLWKSRRAATEGWFSDAHGKVKVMWFNQPYIAKMAPQGPLVKLSGTVGGSAERPYISNPEVVALPTGTVVEEGMFAPTNNQQRVTSDLFPIYPETRGITSKWFFHALKRIFSARAHEQILDPLPKDVRGRYHLPDLATALIYMHAPEDEKHTVAARKRFAFEEIFAIHVARARERAENIALLSFRLDEAYAYAERFLDAAPFSPTGAQRRAVREITTDMQKPYPGARLLEGDVGSGKTLVAAACAYAVVHTKPDGRNSGTLQVAYMAPTEILATQHFNSFIEYFRELPISIALITGSGCKKFPSKAQKDQATDISRTQLLKWVKNGEIAMVVGTHALIQKSVEFQHLALCIVDEQHRFGVNQRKALVRGTNAELTRNYAERNVDPLLYRDITYRIREALFAVKKELGGGHKEIVYQRALAEEFAQRKLAFDREKRIPIFYNKKPVGIYQPDFVVEGSVVVELKAQTFVGTAEKKQLWTYVKGSEYRLALLVNFGPGELAIDRIVYDSARTPASDPRSSASVPRKIPHFLSMTATPIPRTLALTIYGDLDLSVLDELPPGRATVKTELALPNARDRAYMKIREELEQGRQAYVICPRIEEPDPAKVNAIQAKSVKAEAARLKKDIFPDYDIDVLHGALKPAEKDRVLARFAKGDIQILVATSVVEVGINVPNATVILIEGAERFGLAQLHQLRGRVQRSSHQPFCFLLPETRGEQALKRLRALEKSADGFELAERDLELRGAGDLYGARQWGMSDLGMEALKNPRLISAAREEARAIVEADPALTQLPALRARVDQAGGALHAE